MSDENENTPENDEQLAGKIKGSARQIWLAGLGAYTKAEEDAGRFFERLVQEGEQLESKTRGVVEKHVRTVEDRVDDVRKRPLAPGTASRTCLMSACPARCVDWVFTVGTKSKPWNAGFRPWKRNSNASGSRPRTAPKRNDARFRPLMSEVIPAHQVNLFFFIRAQVGQ